MNIFYKRPLSLIICVLLCGFVVSAHCISLSGALIFFLSLLLLAFSLILLILGKRKALFMALISCILLVSTLASALYFGEHFNLRRYQGHTVTVEGYVEDIEKSLNYTATATVAARKIDGEECDTKLLVHFKNKDGRTLYEGAEITFSGTIQTFESSDDFNARSYYHARGISARVTEYEELTHRGEVKRSLLMKIKDFNDTACRHIILTFGADAGALFSALFMGNRTYLSPAITLNFNRIGISHILALSGMHLAILAAGLTALLSFLGVRKKPRTVIMMITTLAYMLLTGLPVSVVRAGLMLIISGVLYLLASMKDSVTNLSLSVLIICIIEPYAIFDTSLWLSAFATLGIIMMSEIMAKRKKPHSVPKRLLMWVLISLMSSFFAIGATMAIATALSDSLSLLGAPSTLVFSLLIELFIYIGIVMLAVGSVFPIGELVMTPIARLIEATAEMFSGSGPIVLSTAHTSTKIAIAVFTASFFMFLILKFKKKTVPLMILGALFISVHICAASDTYSEVHKDDVLLSSSEDRDLIIAKDGGRVIAIDTGRYTSTDSYSTAKVLKSEKLYSVDAYVIGHYYYGTSDYLYDLLRRVKCDVIFLPEPLNEDEATWCKAVCNKLSCYSVEIMTYRIGDEIKAKSISVTQLYREKYGEGVMTDAFGIALSNAKIAYLGSGVLDHAAKETHMQDWISSSDVLIFGSFGKPYEQPYYFEDFIQGIKRIVNRSEKLFLSERTERCYKENGTEIITDPGTVSLIH